LTIHQINLVLLLMHVSDALDSSSGRFLTLMHMHACSR
jgi:hypothetical protein